jgi:quercetin dioxygenase-like cupin family protein
MADSKRIVFADQKPIDRGNGVTTLPLVGGADGAGFAAGITTFPIGAAIPLHSHNVEEMVTVLEGSGECEIEGEVRPVKALDSTFVPPNKVHCFRNTGGAQMRILWVYGGTRVTRTFAATGQTVEHLSPYDKA